MVVRGESGIGKSALVKQLLEELRARAPDALTLAGRCYERESVPFKAFEGLVDALSRHLASQPGEEAAAVLPRDASLLGQVFPVLRRVRAIQAAPALALGIQDPQARRARLFSAMRELLGRVADRRALVLVIDDLQWADVAARARNQEDRQD